MDSSTQCVILVLLEMGLSFFGIVCNLLIVTTLRQDESLRGSTLNYLLLNLCFSNLLISFLVKPISAIYVGYAISTGEHQVGLAFCTLYTFTYRTTWCIFPFTLIALSWCKLLSQVKCSICEYFCCPKKLMKQQVDDEAEIAMLATSGKDGTELSIVHTASQNHSIAAPNPPSASNAPFTELALQYGSGGIKPGANLLFHSMTRDSLSTPTPSTNTDAGGNQLVSQQSVADNSVVQRTSSEEAKDENDKKSLKSKDGKPKRTIEDGPTARQKVLVAFIWLTAAFFGVTTCFPDKVFGVEISQKILEDQRSSIPPSLGTPRDMDLTYCTVKTGLNDLLDYLAIVVSLILPLILGPALVALFQGIITLSRRMFCPSTHVGQIEAAAAMAAGPAGAAVQAASSSNDATNMLTVFHTVARRCKKGPGWDIILGFTIVFVATYPIHMYIAEVYILDDFTFLFVKYCLGFLYVIFVPLVILILQKDIRKGIHSVFGSAVLCLQDIAEGDIEMEQEQQVLNAE